METSSGISSVANTSQLYNANMQRCHAPRDAQRACITISNHSVLLYHYVYLGSGSMALAASEPAAKMVLGGHRTTDDDAEEEEVESRAVVGTGSARSFSAS